MPSKQEPVATPEPTQEVECIACGDMVGIDEAVKCFHCEGVFCQECHGVGICYGGEAPTP